ncbi:MAG: MDR family MFS transporter [Acidimicrobiales bacterium]
MNQKVAVSVVYVAVLFMAIMDSTIVNVALPALGREFHTSADAADGVVIAYLVSLAVFIPTSGWLGDRLGGRKVLLGAIVVFAGSSALCGVASSLGELVVFRVAQGIGGGLMTPVGMAMLWRVFPPAERVRASSILVLVTGLAPATGPVLGGLFVTDLSWRWVFYVNVPIGLAALVFGLAYLSDQRLDRADSFDLWGFVLAGAGLGFVMYAVSEGPLKGWASGDLVVTGCLGVALLIALVGVELRRHHPLLDLRLLKDRLFAMSNAVMFLASIAFLGTLYMVSLFFQDGLGLSALQAGLSMFPEALGVMIGAQFTAKRLYPVLGPRRLMCGGLVVTATGMLALLAVGPGTSLWWARAILFLIGIGMSGVFIPTQTAAFATISQDNMGGASTLFNTERQLGGAVGVAVLTTVLAGLGLYSHIGGHVAPNLDAYKGAFVAAAGFALVGAGLSLRIYDEDAAPTITRWRGHRTVDSPATYSPAAPADGPAGEVQAEIGVATGSTSRSTSA